MTEDRPSFLRDHGVPLLLTIISILIPVLSYLTGFPRAIKDDPGNAVLLGVVLFLISEVLWLSWQMGSIKQMTQEASREVRHNIRDIRRDTDRIGLELGAISRSVAAVKGYSELNELKNTLDRRKDTVGTTGLLTLTQLTNFMKPLGDNRGFEVISEPLALKAYEFFWQIMLDEQKLRKTASTGPIVARVTHSTAPDIWDTQPMRHSISLQKNFIKEGGVIVRVFLDEKPEPPETTQKEMDKMQAYGKRPAVAVL